MLSCFPGFLTEWRGKRGEGTFLLNLPKPAEHLMADSYSIILNQWQWKSKSNGGTYFWKWWRIKRTVVRQLCSQSSGLAVYYCYTSCWPFPTNQQWILLGMLLEHCIKNKDDYGLQVVVILHFENSTIATLKLIWDRWPYKLHSGFIVTIDHVIEDNYTASL